MKKTGNENNMASEEKPGEVAKLQKHLSLLRQEYVKLQNRLVDVEQKYNVALAAAGNLGDDTFIARLLKTIEELFDKDLYSDITVSFANRKIKAHKFVLAARSDYWGNRDLNEISDLELPDVSEDVGLTMMKWVYTDKADVPNDESFLVQLVTAANQYKLTALRGRCEKSLMSKVSVSNCIKFYQTAETIGANELRKYCAEIISSHWNDLKKEDFVSMSAPLLYEMFKSKSHFPLHLAIKHHREDVVFLYLIEFNSQLPGKLNEFDPSCEAVPLHIALVEQQDSIAKTLVGHNCDLNMPDTYGVTLLHKAIKRGDDFAATFLIQNGALVGATTHVDHITPLHLAALYKPWNPDTGSSELAAKMTSAEGMARVASLLLANGANTDAQDANGSTPLHQAIAVKNVPLFSVLIKHERINLELRDNEGRAPLWFALLEEGVNPDDEDSLAAKLVANGASPDSVNPATGDSLLHLAADNESAGLFLVSHGAQPNHANKKGETPLHAASRHGLPRLVNKLLESGANPNAQTIETEEDKIRALGRAEARQTRKSQARVKAMQKANELKQSREKQRERERERIRDLTKDKNKPDDKSVQPNENDANPFEEDLGNPFEDSSEPMSFDSSDGNNPFLDDLKAVAQASAAMSGITGYDSVAAMGGLTIGNSAEDDVSNTDYPEVNLEQLTAELEQELDMDDKEIVIECGGRTALHMAIVEKHEDVVNCFIEFEGSGSRGGGMLHIVPDFNTADSEEQTPLELALWTGQYQIASHLLESSADINVRTSTGLTLLHKAIRREDTGGALFLIEQGADINTRTKDDRSPLQLAIQRHLEPAVDSLCERGADLNSCDEYGNCPLWLALKSKQQDIASTLVRYGCDTDGWNMGPSGCTQSLLHRSISERDESAACFLIRSGCDVNSPRRPGPDGTGGVEAWDGLTPLHLACATGLDTVVQCLLEHKVNVNVKDSESRAPIHIAIRQKNPITTRLLLSHPELNMNVQDRSGQTPFAVALSIRDHEAAAAILAREPGGAEQFDNRGRNYLHSAILSGDVETVLFMIGVTANVNSRIQDSSHRTPLHLAVVAGSEIIVRHLLLAGAQINELDKHRQTALHMAAAENHFHILSILLDNRVDVDAVDENLNNALHLAMQQGHLESIRVLLTESSINAEALNARGQNTLHILSQYGKENAVTIFELFRQCMPDYPINALDSEDNTAMFLAYVNGQARLCKELLKAGSSIATINQHGASIFNTQVPTKKLLFTLLDLLNAEPPWSDGPNCHECGIKFGVKTRKHHCRHCGRLVCNKCSNKQIPIIKYELSKPVRVCDMCFDMLSSGISS